ncbi:hypothetical protein OS493_035655 [Desmophyllum pertusum]|uniref:Uncharacterized protein n=1 Tax=Desmophyllum pertusum TaxID=174260 RepID=A0A9W9Z8F8_9CNID|nr:hypothetical protein OS493_035655 [Desmophyllum pertusum]
MSASKSNPGTPKKGVNYFHHFPKAFLVPYGKMKEEFLTDRRCLEMLTTQNSEWLLRPKFALSEMAETFPANIEVMQESLDEISFPDVMQHCEEVAELLSVFNTHDNNNKPDRTWQITTTTLTWRTTTLTSSFPRHRLGNAVAAERLDPLPADAGEELDPLPAAEVEGVDPPAASAAEEPDVPAAPAADVPAEPRHRRRERRRRTRSRSRTPPRRPRKEYEDFLTNQRNMHYEGVKESQEIVRKYLRKEFEDLLRLKRKGINERNSHYEDIPEAHISLEEDNDSDDGEIDDSQADPDNQDESWATT